MNLPSDLYQEITSSINVVGRDQPRESDRRAPRVKLSSHLAVANWADPAVDMSVRIRDLSQGGIGLFHSQRIGLDEQLLIRFPRNNQPPVMVLGTVVYWEPLSENLYAIGVQFDEQVDQPQVDARSHRAVQQQSNQVGMMTKFTQAFARTWRIAS